MSETGTQLQEQRKGGRPAAGTDPEKRQQIFEGAKRVFTSVGFDAASMSDIAREADVSKATLYVYFSSKEQLFAAICAEERDRNISEMIALLDRNEPLEDVLFKLGRECLHRMLTKKVFPAHRIVIGVAERMPEIGRELYKSGPLRLIDELSAFLAHHAAHGRLVIPDTKLASAQFMELTQATVFRRNIYAASDHTPSDSEIDYIVRSAVTVFMAAYGAEPHMGKRAICEPK